MKSLPEQNCIMDEGESRSAVLASDPFAVTLAGIPLALSLGMITYNPLTLQTFRDAYLIATSSDPVLISGEPGSGKKMLAAFIQRNSRRADKPFVTVNCRDVVPHDLPSVLFGRVNHKDGEILQKGKVFEADGGTLFIDEIGNMPVLLQTIMLRVLETGRCAPLGGSQEHAVDFRLLASTSHNLLHEILTGNFRKDLYYRLTPISFELLPLRKRPEDILPLARLMLSRRGITSPTFDPIAARLLLRHTWPENIRELQQVMNRITFPPNQSLLRPELLPPHWNDPPDSASPGTPSLQPLSQPDEKQAILDAMKQARGSRKRAASLLNMNRRELIYKIQRYDLRDI